MQKKSNCVSTKSSLFTAVNCFAAVLLLVYGLLLTSTAFASQAPELSLKKLDNTNFKLSDYRGEVVYLDFWATWCPPCRQSFPWMEEMNERYGDLGFKVVAISLDVKREVIDQFLKTMTTHFVIAHDPSGESATQFKVKGMPSSYLIDRKGNIHMTHMGFNNNDKSKLEAEIKKLIAEE